MPEKAGEHEELVRSRRRRIVESLYEHERHWRLRPGDGGDPAALSPLALRREVELDRRVSELLRGWQPESDEARAARVERERHALKHFPILFVSAPHLDETVNGTFPGTPTPLLYATAVLDRHLRIDEFPSSRVPEVVAVMNPAVYTPEFRDELTELVASRRPRLVGISSLSEGHYYGVEIAKLVKAAWPEAVVVMGGQHEDGTNPLVYERLAGVAGAPARHPVRDLGPRALLRAQRYQTLADANERRYVDFVAAGDGPYLLMELVRLLAENLDATVEELKSIVRAHAAGFRSLPGSGFLFSFNRDEERIEHVELSGTPIDGNEVPFIDVGHLTHENRFPVFEHKKTAQIMACLGCKYACSFCHESADHLLYGLPKLLQRTPQNVMQEWDLRAEQGFEAVFFDDSTFTQNRKWVDELLALLELRRGRGEGLEWGCQTTILDLTPSLAQRMGRAGCSYIYFGVESARPSLDHVQKARPLARRGDAWGERFAKVAGWVADAGIRVGTSLQFGLGETAADRTATLDLVGGLYDRGVIAKHCVALNINAPYPGTLQWVECLSDPRRAPPDYRSRLVRHTAFETAHQHTALPADVADAIYREASERLGDAILSVDFAERRSSGPDPTASAVAARRG